MDVDTDMVLGRIALLQSLQANALAALLGLAIADVETPDSLRTTMGETYELLVRESKALTTALDIWSSNRGSKR